MDLLVVDLQEAELYVWLLLRLRIRRVLEDLAEAPGDSSEKDSPGGRDVS